MSYRRKIWKLRRGVFVIDEHGYGFSQRGQKRTRTGKPTTKAKKRLNQKKREERCKMQLMHYFREGDHYITMNYAKDLRPANMAEAIRDRKKIATWLRKQYKKRGAVLFWMCNIEAGKGGAYHMHWIINRIPDSDLLINEIWGKVCGYSSVKMEPIREDITQLAAYITKTPESMKEAKENGGVKSEIRESNFSASRNMPLPEPKIKKKMSNTWGRIVPPVGYYIDKNSLYEGVNPFTGYSYRKYWLLPIPPNKRQKKRPTQGSASAVKRENVSHENT